MHKLPYNNQAGGAMKILKKLLGAALSVAALSAPIAEAGQIVWNFSNAGLYSGTGPATLNSDPYARATISWVDGSTSASIFMQVFSGVLVDPGAYVNDWFFNLDPSNQFSTVAYASGIAAKSLYWTQPNNYNADGGGYFDLQISFDTKNPGQLGQGLDSTYIVTTTSALFDADNPFAFDSVHPKGGTTVDPRLIESAIHVQGYGNSAWIKGSECAPNDTTCGPPVQDFCTEHPDDPACLPQVPEPATLAIIGAGLFSMAITRRRRGKF